jgi:two-component system NtrC family response regulator
MAKILIVDDDPIFYEPLAYYIKTLGHTCDVAKACMKGKHMAAQNEYDLIFLDILFPDGSGLEAISTFKAMSYSPEVIVITGKADLKGAEQALTEGALDYLEKPPSYDMLSLLIERALQHRAQKLNFSESQFFQRDAIIGSDPGLRRCLEIIARAAPTEGSVLITGETGTGKELMAQAVHLNSKRSKGRLVTVDCTNLPPTLAETLLFGHVKGTFTGAVCDSEGLVQQAIGGTLYLEEVGDMHPAVQKSFLGVLQKKTYRPLGAKMDKTSNFRVVSSTNKDLMELIMKNQFRKDLYYRLAAFRVNIPPLRERVGDIKSLVNYYVSKICGDLGIDGKGISNEYMSQLLGYNWPGNVREIINVIHTSIANAINAPVLFPHHLPVELRVHLRKKSIKITGDQNISRFPVEVAFNSDQIPELKDFKHIANDFYLNKLIELAAGDPDRACRISGVSRSGLYQLLSRHGKKMKTGK